MSILNLDPVFFTETIFYMSGGVLLPCRKIVSLQRTPLVQMLLRSVGGGYVPQYPYSVHAAGYGQTAPAAGVWEQTGGGVCSL